MKVLSFVAVFAGLTLVVLINAGSGRRAWITAGSIAIVVGGLILLMVLFAYFVTRPAL